MTEDLVLPAPRDAAPEDSGDPLLVVEGLTKHFPVKGGFPIRRTVGAVQAVDGIDLTVHVGRASASSASPAVASRRRAA